MLPYKAKAEFKGDTLQYLERNFAKRSAYYEGRTVGELLKDLEYQVLYVEGIYQTTLDASNESDKFVGLTLCIRQVGKERSELKDYYINVFFENPPLLSDYRAIYDVQEHTLTSQLYDFIKDLRVKNVYSNEHILKDQELKAARKQVHIKMFEKMIEDAKQAGAKEEDMKIFKEGLERVKRE